MRKVQQSPGLDPGTRACNTVAIFEDIEKRLETLVESFFGRRFPSPLQPVEIAKSMVKEMDRKHRVSLSLIYAPNDFAIKISPVDYENLESISSSLCREFREYLLAHSKKRGYSLVADVKVRLLPAEDIGTGMMSVEADFSDDIAPEPEGLGHTQMLSPQEAAGLGLGFAGRSPYLLDLTSGQRYDLGSESLTVGREQGSDILLDEPSVSRNQAELRRQGPRVLVLDLGSTNGTLVNDKPVTEAILEDEDRLTFGNVTLVFRGAE